LGLSGLLDRRVLVVFLLGGNFDKLQGEDPQELLMEYEVVAAFLKGLVSGVVGFLVQRSLKKGLSELERLQQKPPDVVDHEWEELLNHFVENASDVNEQLDGFSSRQGFRILKLRTDISVTYLYLKVRKLYLEVESIRDEGENPKDV
jgi:hypothetical protein